MTKATRFIALAATLAACSSNPVGEYTSSQGSLAVSPDERLAFAADEDNGLLEVIDLATFERIASVNVGRRPQFVVAGKKGEVYVSNRLSRSVSVVRKTDLGWQVAGEAKVGAEPTGLALSPDGALLAVANSSSGTVSLVDTASLGITGEIKVGGTPRAVAFRPGAKELYVTDYFGAVRTASIESQSVTGTIGLTVPPGTVRNSGTRSPSHVTSVTLSPDGKRAFVTHAQCKDDMIVTETGAVESAVKFDKPDSGGGNSYGGGPDGSPPVVAPAITTIDTASQTPIAQPIDGDDTVEAPPPMLMAGGGRTTIAMPYAAVVDPNGGFLLMANLSSNNVAAISTRRTARDEFADEEEGLHSVTKVGAGPTGIALAQGGKIALVHNSFDHSLSVLEQTSDKRGLAVTRTVGLTASPLTGAQQRGRALFFTAVDSKMTNQTTGIACASCHGDGGRTDGRTWNFSEGPRNTPTLAFKELVDTAPFHWDGAIADIPAFDQIIQHRMGGAGLDPADFADLVAYLKVIPESDNPHKSAALTPEQQLGKRLFDDAAKGDCASCHTGDAYTTNELKQTVTPFGLNNRIAVPPLRGVFGTAPYRHDGSAATLRELFTSPGSIAEMDMTARLTGAEIDALVAYVETL